MSNTFSRIAAPIIAAFAITACSTAPKEVPDEETSDLSSAEILEGMLSFAMMASASQGYEIGATCRNDNRAGFTAWSPEKSEYHLVLAKDNKMEGKAIKAADTSYEKLQEKLNNHCFPKP